MKINSWVLAILLFCSTAGFTQNKSDGQEWFSGVSKYWLDYGGKSNLLSMRWHSLSSFTKGGKQSNSFVL